MGNVTLHGRCLWAENQGCPVPALLVATNEVDKIASESFLSAIDFGNLIIVSMVRGPQSRHSASSFNTRLSDHCGRKLAR